MVSGRQYWQYLSACVPWARGWIADEEVLSQLWLKVLPKPQSRSNAKEESKQEKSMEQKGWWWGKQQVWQQSANRKLATFRLEFCVVSSKDCIIKINIPKPQLQLTSLPHTPTQKLLRPTHCHSKVFMPLSLTFKILSPYWYNYINIHIFIWEIELYF